MDAGIKKRPGGGEVSREEVPVGSRGRANLLLRPSRDWVKKAAAVNVAASLGSRRPARGPGGEARF